MGEHLWELEKKLRYDKQGNFTSPDEQFIKQCKLDSIKEFSVGAGVGGILTLLGTPRWQRINRIGVSIGVACVCGTLRMGKHLLGLEPILVSKQGNLTSPEEEFIMQYKLNAVKDLCVGFAVGGILTLPGTRRLRFIHRFCISAGVGCICGSLRFDRALDSGVEHILSLNGTRVQNELAKIVAKKHQDDHWTMQLLTRHFYLERVYDDTVMDPKLRWRYRAFFYDQITDSQRTNNTSNNKASDLDGADAEHTDQSKQAYVRYPAVDPSTDPFNYKFVSEEINHAGTPRGVHQSKRQHGYKRSLHSRHQIRGHQEASADLEIALH